MVILSKSLTNQVSALSARVNGYTRSIRHLTVAVSVCGLLGLCSIIVSHFYFVMALTEVDIPVTLLREKVVNHPLLSGIGVAEMIWWGLRHVWVLVLPYLFITTWRGTRWKIRSLDDAKELATLVLSGLAITFTAYLMPAGIDFLYGDGSIAKKLNNRQVMEILKAGDQGPINQEYLGKVHTLPERYTLAQIAIMSKAKYPDNFFRKLADDLQGVRDFVPSEQALFAIETAATGQPVTPRVIERAAKMADYRAIARGVGKGAAGLSLFLICCGVGLALIRRSITRRLTTIQALMG